VEQTDFESIGESAANQNHRPTHLVGARTVKGKKPHSIYKEMFMQFHELIMS
jgi:hypothetical protein